MNRLEAERKLEALAARKKQQAEELAQQSVTPRFADPEKSKATAEWAASQASQNPRLAAGHPNANPLRNTYVEDDEISQASEVWNNESRL